MTTQTNDLAHLISRKFLASNGTEITDLRTIDTFDEIYAAGRTYTDQDIDTFKAWMEQHPQVHYYAESREYFSMRDAVDQAAAAGKTYLLAEDLS